MQGLLIALPELIAKKAEGPGGIPGELLKSLGSMGKQELFAICNQIYETGAWPNEFMESVIFQLKRRVVHKSM